VLATELELPAAALAANDEGKTPLMLACSLPTGGEAVVQFLLGLGADPAAVDVVSNINVHPASYTFAYMVEQHDIALSCRQKYTLNCASMLMQV
jgi:hypothetical protein